MLPALVERLVAQYGARRVVLFGSLAWPDRFGPDSDIDLLVWGLETDDPWQVEWDLGTLTDDVRIDLVPAEWADDGLPEWANLQGTLLVDDLDRLEAFLLSLAEVADGREA